MCLCFALAESKGEKRKRREKWRRGEREKRELGVTGEQKKGIGNNELKTKEINELV